MHLGLTSLKDRARAARRTVVQAAALVAMGLPTAAMAAPAAPTPVNNQFFDWFVTNNPAPANVVPAPFLTDSNAASVNTLLLGLAPGDIRAVKVEHPIANSTANLIFNNTNYHVSYVFGDLEGATAASDAAKLASQVKFINGTGAATTSSRAWIGNFGFSNVPSDPTQPKDYQKQFNGKHSFSGFGKQDFNAAGLTMNNEEVYPGSPSFRNPAANNSSAPNIRSALFTLPIVRVSNATATSDAATPNIPWTANFNNWGNDALNNASSPLNTDGKAYFWDNPTHDQMPSRRDYATMITHFRMRGADSVHLLQSGVVGVSDSDMINDTRTGWIAQGETVLSNILNATDSENLLEAKKVTYPYGQFDGMSKIIQDHKTQDVEDAGSILSGVYSESLGKLDLLISNMDDSPHTITAPSSVGGYSLNVRDFALMPGTHMLVEYTLTPTGKNKGWAIAGQHVPFTAIDNSRHHFGIPEPGTLSLLAVGAVLGVNRRSRKNAKKA